MIEEMQQTEHLKLNLIETGDPLSPAPLNENAEKIEAALTALDGADAALDARVTALEVQKIFFGTVVYESSPQFVNLGFTPKAVLFLGRNVGNNPGLAVGDKYLYHKSGGQETIHLRIVENGFIVAGYSVSFFASGEHNYIAFV